MLTEDNIAKPIMLTPFQAKVYKIVSTIPRSETRTYKWVAEKLGNPKASRAVGQALKRNPFIGKVPCHRVVRSDGSLGGFSRGVKEKKRLLDKENVLNQNHISNSINRRGHRVRRGIVLKPFNHEINTRLTQDLSLLALFISLSCANLVKSCGFIYFGFLGSSLCALWFLCSLWL